MTCRTRDCPIVQWIDDDHWAPRSVGDYEWQMRQKVINGVTRLA